MLDQMEGLIKRFVIKNQQMDTFFIQMDLARLSVKPLYTLGLLLNYRTIQDLQLKYNQLKKAKLISRGHNIWRHYYNNYTIWI